MPIPKLLEKKELTGDMVGGAVVGAVATYFATPYISGFLQGFPSWVIGGIIGGILYMLHYGYLALGAILATIVLFLSGRGGASTGTGTVAGVELV